MAEGHAARLLAPLLLLLIGCQADATVGGLLDDSSESASALPWKPHSALPPTPPKP